ncbi:MAG: hypothetical protein AB1486_25330 [Planctomycetota bacterium]
MPTSFEWYFGPFVKERDKLAHILTLYRKDKELVDWPAIIEIARCFQKHRYPNLKVVPSGPLSLAPDVILIGAADLYWNPDATGFINTMPSRVGEEQFGERLIEIERESAYEFRKIPSRAIVNRLTGQVFEPHKGKDGITEIDFGVNRRALRGPPKNTLSIEGVHRWGTAAGTIAVTEPAYLDAIRKVFDKLPARDNSALLEILVKGVYDPRVSQNPTIEAVNIELLQMAYKGQWVYDFKEGKRWEDRKPWHIRRKLTGTKPPASVEGPLKGRSPPRMEVQIDLTDAEPDLQELCQRLLSDPSGDDRPQGLDTKHTTAAVRALDAEKERLIEALLSRSDSIQMELIEPGLSGDDADSQVLPERPSHIRSVRKGFLLHLLLCRLLGTQFHCNDACIRRFYPDYNPSSTGKPLASKFAGNVRGKLRAGFKPLFTMKAVDKAKRYLHTDYNRADKTYSLHLDALNVVVMIRLSDPFAAPRQIAAGPGIPSPDVKVIAQVTKDGSGEVKKKLPKRKEKSQEEGS